MQAVFQLGDARNTDLGRIPGNLISGAPMPAASPGEAPRLPMRSQAKFTKGAKLVLSN